MTLKWRSEPPVDIKVEVGTTRCTWRGRVTHPLYMERKGNPPVDIKEGSVPPVDIKEGSVPPVVHV